MENYPEEHLQGHISFENLDWPEIAQALKDGFMDGDIGVQVSDDGRIWICLNGVAFIRASSHPNRMMHP